MSTSGSAPAFSFGSQQWKSYKTADWGGPGVCRSDSDFNSSAGVGVSPSGGGGNVPEYACRGVKFGKRPKGLTDEIAYRQFRGELYPGPGQHSPNMNAMSNKGRSPEASLKTGWKRFPISVVSLIRTIFLTLSLVLIFTLLPAANPYISSIIQICSQQRCQLQVPFSIRRHGEASTG